MMMTQAEAKSTESLLYVVLGVGCPERDKALCQMVEHWQFHDLSVQWCHHSEELPEDLPEFERLIDKGLSTADWSLHPENSVFEKAPVDSTSTEVTLFVAHGGKRLVDTIEALSKWLPRSSHHLERILTWVHAGEVASKTPVQRWYQCCYYFSDAIIIDAFKDLPNSWLKEYTKKLHSDCYPFIIENTRKGRLKNLTLLLDNQVRRISQAFEFDNEIHHWDIELESDMEEESLEDELPQKEIYFERHPDGRRSKLVPELEVN